MAGDSVLAVFETAAGAVSPRLPCSKRSRILRTPCRRTGECDFRIGVHLGDLIEKNDGTVYGDGVNIAARLQALAEPGGIAISESIRTAVKGKVDATFEDRANRGEEYRRASAGVSRSGQREQRVRLAARLPNEAGLASDKPSIAVLPFKT